MQNQSHRFALLGASRGLGWATYLLLIQKFPEAHFLLVSRKIQNNQVGPRTIKITQDFSRAPVEPHFLDQIAQFSPTEIIYCAGGGPYGNFADKKWSDHLWALNVNFLYPAQLIHHFLGFKNQWPQLKSITLIGSDIAQNQPDQKAASYAAAKHALKGLLTTLQIESTGKIQVKLFSPGYMNTQMLPQNSAPRLENKAQDVNDVARKLVEFIDSPDSIWSTSMDKSIL